MRTALFLLKVGTLVFGVLAQIVTAQTLSRGGGGGSTTGSVRVDASQSLSPEQKSTGRANLGLGELVPGAPMSFVRTNGTGTGFTTDDVLLPPWNLWGNLSTNDGRPVPVHVSQVRDYMAAQGWLNSGGTTIDYTPVAVTGTTIDLSSGQSFYKSITAPTTLTITGAAATQGLPKVVRLTNTGNHTVSWAGVGLVWENGVAPVLDTGSASSLFWFFPDGSQVFGRKLAGPFVSDTTKPTVSEAPTIDAAGTSISIPWSENVSGAPGSTAGFSLSGTTATFSAFSAGEGTSTITYTLSPAAKAGQSVVLAYAPSSYPLADLAGNKPDAITGQSVSNLSTISDYLLAENFNSGSQPANTGSVTYTITAAGALFVSTPAIEGSYSLRTTGPANSTVQGLTITAPALFPDSGTEWWFAVRAQEVTLPSALSISIQVFNEADAEMFRVRTSSSSGAMIMQNVAQTITGGSFVPSAIPSASPGPIFYLWFRFKSDGGVELYGSESGTQGTLLGQLTAAQLSAGGNVKAIKLGSSQSGSIRWDTVRVGTSNPGSNFP